MSSIRYRDPERCHNHRVPNSSLRDVIKNNKRVYPAKIDPLHSIYTYPGRGPQHYKTGTVHAWPR